MFKERARSFVTPTGTRTLAGMPPQYAVLIDIVELDLTTTTDDEHDASVDK